MELNAKRLGIAGGILWGVAVFLMTWFSMWFGYGTLFMDLIADIYPGYEVTAIGSFIGLIWGFVDGFVGLFILAWLYNKINV